MRFFEWFSRVPTDASPVPSMQGEFQTALFDVLAEDGLTPLNAELETAIDSAISDLFIHIEYAGIDGSLSRRPITIKKQLENQGRISLVAMCHQSGAIKWFRLDKITAVISADGVVYRPASVFWDLVGYDTGSVANTKSEDKNADISAANIKKTYKHRLRVLAALAGADGHLHVKEVPAITAYLIAEVRGAGGRPAVGAETGLAEHIKRMRVTRECLDESLDALFGPEASSLSAAELQRFLAAARQVVDADGLFHRAEFEFLDYLETEYLDDVWNLVGDDTPGTRRP